VAHAQRAFLSVSSPTHARLPMSRSTPLICNSSRLHETLPVLPPRSHVIKVKLVRRCWVLVERDGYHVSVSLFKDAATAQVSYEHIQNRWATKNWRGAIGNALISSYKLTRHDRVRISRAVPTLVSQLPSLRPDLRAELARRLLARSEDGGGVLAWNASRNRAQSVLRAHRAELRRSTRPQSP
jgi:hypothetical protein